MTLSDSALSYYDQVVVSADELARRQLLHLRPLDRLGVELPVERRQRLLFAEARLAHAMGDAPLTPLPCLLRDQLVQEFHVRLPRALRARQRCVELLRTQRYLERRKVGQDLRTQVSRRRRWTLRLAGHRRQAPRGTTGGSQKAGEGLWGGSEGPGGGG